MPRHRGSPLPGAIDHGGLDSHATAADASRMERETFHPVVAAGPAAPAPIEIISPELCLVDPELAARARAALPDPGWLSPRKVVLPERADAVRAMSQSRSLQLPITVPAPEPVAPVHEPDVGSVEQDAEAPRPSRRRHRWPRLATATALVAAIPTVATVGAEIGPRTAFAPTSEAAPLVAGDRTTPQLEAPPDAAAQPQVFAWAPVRDARGYEFQLFRGRTLVFRARVAAPRLTVPGRWHAQGRRQQLDPGTYRWYVWPVSRGTGKRAAKAVVSAQLVVGSPSNGDEDTSNPGRGDPANG